MYVHRLVQACRLDLYVDTYAVDTLQLPDSHVQNPVGLEYQVFLKGYQSNSFLRCK